MSSQNATLEDRAGMRFEPTVMAQDLAASVEVLSADIQAVPTNRLDGSEAERLTASIDASLEALRRIRSHLDAVTAARPY